ncbi:MAG: hypothetical protein FJ146_11000 [Deltaproteobacteria bacterium]|nr:hypothetical protein [Deltaproteobacteria bacterium]
MTIGLTACGSGSGSGSSSFSGDGAPDPVADKIVDQNFEAEGPTKGLPKLQAKEMISEFVDMKLDQLYEFLRKVSGNETVNAGGTKITRINDTLKKYRGHFFKIRKDFHRVEDFWDFMKVNPKTVTPNEFKGSLREMGIFVTRVALPALIKKPSDDKSPLNDTKIRNKGRACVIGTPLLLNSCVNMRNREACNLLTGSMICVVHYMFKAKEKSPEAKKEGFDNEAAEGPDGAEGGEGGGEGGE